MDAIKFAPDSQDIIEGWGAPFGGIFNGKDLDGESFTKSTDFCLDWFDERPLLYHHGLDDNVQTAVVGRVKSAEMRDEGLWVQAQLDKTSKFFGAIQKVIEKKASFFSSGAMSHLVAVDGKKNITRWPWVELSLTPEPSNVLATLDFATAEKHFKSAGLDTDALKAKLTAAAEAELSDSDFAYIDPDGGRHLPIPDEEHVRAAMSRFDQTHFDSDAARQAAHARIMAAAKKFGMDVEKFAMPSGKSADVEAGDHDGLKALDGSYEDLIDDLSDALNPASPFGAMPYSCIIATFPDSVLVCRRDPMDDDDDSYWRISYSLDDAGEPVLGKVQQVEQTYVPKKSHTPESLESPLTLDAERLSRHAGAFAQRTEGLHERRVKEGRALSRANRSKIAAAIDTLSAASEALTTLLDASDGMLNDQAKAAALSAPESLLTELQLLELFEQTI